MTGFFIRTTNAEGKSIDIEIEKLTDQQLNEFVSKMDAYEAKRWIIGLVVWIKDHVKEEPSKNKIPITQIYGEFHE